MNNPVERALKYSPDALARFIRDNMRDLSKSNAHLTALFKDATALDERTKDLPDESVSYVLLNVLYRLVVEGKLNYKHINSMHFLNVMMFDKETELLNMLVSPDPDGWLVDRLHGHVKLPSVKLEELIDGREKGKDLHYESNAALAASVLNRQQIRGWNVLLSSSLQVNKSDNIKLGNLLYVYSKAQDRVVAAYSYDGVQIQNAKAIVQSISEWSTTNLNLAIILQLGSSDQTDHFKAHALIDNSIFQLDDGIVYKLQQLWSTNVLSNVNFINSYAPSLYSLNNLLAQYSINNITKSIVKSEIELNSINGK